MVLRYVLSYMRDILLIVYNFKQFWQLTKLAPLPIFRQKIHYSPVHKVGIESQFFGIKQTVTTFLGNLGG